MNKNVARRICALSWDSTGPFMIRRDGYGGTKFRAPQALLLSKATRRGLSYLNPPRKNPFAATSFNVHHKERSHQSLGLIAQITKGKVIATIPTAGWRNAISATASSDLAGRPTGPHRNPLSWRRSIHTSRKRQRGGGYVTGDGSHRGRQSSSQGSPGTGDSPPTKSSRKILGSPVAGGHASNKHLLGRLPHMPNIHRPSREELLAAATGFWSRLKVRFKWFSIRSVRPFNTDDLSAFFSWFILGQVIWILVGTTTFFSLVILTANTVFAQETLARSIGNYLTKSSGVKVVFESAIVPKWGDGVITFKNVFVSRRPGQGNSKVSKGSPTKAAAAAAAARLEEGGDGRDASLASFEEEDTNYTQLDLTLDTVNVTLSFAKWFNGKGLLRDVEIKGIRGVVDRTSVHYPEGEFDPQIYKHEHNTGDFEINSFKMEDLLITVHQPNGFRPYSVSIFSCDLPQLRKQWLFYDFLSANTMSGSFDESLFTIHPRQSHGYTGAQSVNGAESNGDPSPWKKHSRIRIDGLNIDHLNRGVEGPFSWIHEGNVDIVAELMFPADTDESIGKVMSDFYDRMEATVTSNRYLEMHADRDRSRNTGVSENADVAQADTLSRSDDDKRFLVMDLRLHLNDVRAGVPLFTRDLSYVNNALIRPIVAYINSRRTFIPITCQLVKRARDFDGSWTIFDSGLMGDLSAETYQAFARNVVDDQARMRRFKKVGLWSLQLAIQALFMGMAGNIA
ncbi:MAG: Mitochondrial distribution and morphology protein 31, mitochondrial precursor [Sclerophora amabilis]|nr:MAG: Mitochondrial distribution and morphology protein 31, mitochondrial precursor [Sclerophora amabilis]